MTKDLVIKFFLLRVLFIPILTSSPALADAKTSVSEPAASTISEPAPVPAQRLELKSLVTDFNLKGLFVTELMMYLRPSALTGTSEFRVPFANLEAEVKLKGEAELQFELAYRSPLPAGSTSNEFQVRQASYQQAIGEEQNGLLRFGLIESESLRGHKSFWRFDKTHRDLDWLSQRWGYGTAGDYGLEFQFGREGFRAGLGIVNGEGLQTSEVGPQKDFSVWLARTWTAEERSTELLLSAVRGGYENVPGLESAKERYSVSLLSSANTGVYFGAEGLWTRDPADAIHLKVADAADLMDRSGERVSGRLSSITLGYRGHRERAGPGWELFVRQDLVQPLSGEEERGLVSSQTGLVYTARPGVDWLFHLSNIDYGERHSLSPRDEQTWRLSFHVHWD